MNQETVIIFKKLKDEFGIGLSEPKIILPNHAELEKLLESLLEIKRKYVED